MSDRPAGGALLRASLVTLASRGVGAGVSLVTGIVVARVWGLEGKGLLSLLAAATALAVRVGVVGFDASVAQFLLVRRVEVPRGLGTVFALALGAGVGGAVAAHLALLALPAVTDPTGMTAARLQATALPAAFVLFVVTYAFFALGRAVAFAIFDVGYRAGTLAATVIAAAIGAGVLTVVSLQIAATVAAAAAGLTLVWRWSGGGWRFSPGVASAMIGYGARTYVYGLGRYVLAHGSLLACGAALGAGDAGLFSVSLMLGEVVALTAGSVALAFGPSVALSASPWTHTRQVAGLLAAIATALALVIAVVAPVLVPRVFGLPFAGASTLYLWLVPGVVALGVEQILGSYFARTGMSWRIAGLMFAGALLSAAAWTSAAQSGLTRLAWTTSLLQVTITLVLADQFRRARRRPVDGGSGGPRPEGLGA